MTQANHDVTVGNFLFYHMSRRHFQCKDGHMPHNYSIFKFLDGSEGQVTNIMTQAVRSHYLNTWPAA